ncbi:DUF3990 domain-containing protein [Adlercreutzia sp. ZJ473]|uniref:DUF3990 domain-containing protein n=1 Tax=Adlercreutzia sp. ZJ473 TaxID=2722822 RepID=UPI0015540DBD|nr:DUF3990 domain-containing protein [Adlercreutzia sp. ZJ473]
MRKLADGLSLYHGSYTEVSDPDLSKCALHKDFGRGFYLTTSLQQARSFARLSLRKAKANKIVAAGVPCGYVSRFTFHAPVEELNVMAFDSADAAWLHCVVAHRKDGAFPLVLEKCLPCDVIVGKVANDQTNATIAAYMADVFGPLGSKQADEICIGLLLPERLSDQFCFRSSKSLSCLTFEGNEET